MRLLHLNKKTKMDFLDPVKIRSHRTRLFIGYGLMVILIGLGAIILLFQTYGYDYDRKTGIVFQNGLVFASSRPVATDVLINDIPYKDKTDTRFSIPEGRHNIKLKADGYRTWSRDFNLEGGSIERLTYPLLFPESIKSEEAQLLPAKPDFASQSPDRRWLLVKSPANLQSLDKYDTKDPLLGSVPVNLPANLLSVFSGTRNLEPIEWSTDNRHVLLRHFSGTLQEYVMVDTEVPAESFNINKLFKLDQSVQVVLRDKSPSKLYLYNPTSKLLQSADVISIALSTVSEKVLAFKGHGEDLVIFAVAPTELGAKTKIVVRDQGQNYILREGPNDGIWKLDVARFDNSWYFVVGNSAEGKQYIYKDPLNILRKATKLAPVPSAVLKVANLQEVAFSNNARFVMVRGGQNFAVFDADAVRQYKYEIKDTFGTQSVSWMDGHRFTLVSAQQVLVFDFDGTNQQKIAQSLDDFKPYFSPDYDFLYTYANSQSVPGKLALFRHDLVL